jgi:alpha-glucosidase
VANAAGKDDPLIQPTLDILPVYVRAGTILPMQPLVQSTGETPQGALTLRVYPGNDCHGSVYLDDGKSMAYKHGDMLRMEFSCQLTPAGVLLHIGKHEGTFHPWWSKIHVEVYGWNFPGAAATLRNNPRAPEISVDAARNVLSLDLTDDGNGSDLEIRDSR